MQKKRALVGITTVITAAAVAGGVTAVASQAGEERAVPASVAAAAPHGKQNSRTHVVAAFDGSRGENPENIVVGKDGSIYLTMLFAHSVVKIAPDGTRTTVALPGQRALGIAENPKTGTLSVSIHAEDPKEIGIWTVPKTAFGAGGKPVRSVAMPVDSFANGIVYDENAVLYSADIRGAVWRIKPGQTEVTTPWFKHKLLEPNGREYAGAPMPGANGIKLWRGALYVANTSQNYIVRIPVRYGQAGIPKVAYKNLETIDDFTMDGKGNVYAALNTVHRVVRMSPSGKATTLMTHDTGGHGLENPTSVALGQSRRGHTPLYVNNSGFASSTPKPSLLALQLPGHVLH